MLYFRVMGRLEKRAHRACAHADEIIHEISAKAVEITNKVVTDDQVSTWKMLRLPSAFTVDLTFNQGKFQSLKDLLDAGGKPAKVKNPKKRRTAR
jgi:electron transfer flavoprotein alpha/beta subunit